MVTMVFQFYYDWNQQSYCYRFLNIVIMIRRAYPAKTQTS